MEKEDFKPDDSVLRRRLNNTESLEKLDDTLVHLPPSQSVELISLLQSFPELFGDTPLRTVWAEHEIDVGNASPLKQRYYRVSPEKRKLIAIPSNPDWAELSLPVCCNGSVRFCMNFHKLNSVTKPDCFPLPRVDGCIE